MAIQNDEFWESVSHTFQGDGTELDERTKLVESKFYYAGTCPCFMFGSSIDEIKDTISKAIGSMSRRTSDRTSTKSILLNVSKYTLLSFLYGQNRVFYQTGFVSHHAARAFGTCYAADAIRSLPKECTLQTNPEARGWVFEALFLATATRRPDIVVQTISRDAIILLLLQTLYKQGRSLSSTNPSRLGTFGYMIESVHPNVSCTGARFGDVGTGQFC